MATRNKYNTLTPAEAKKLGRFLANRPPIRTASVLHKPRPPPMVVTDLDSVNSKALVAPPAQSANNLPNGLRPFSSKNLAQVNARSSFSCSNHSYRSHRHSINLGQHKHIVSNRYATLQANTKYCYGQNNDNNSRNSTLKTSPTDSESNLSFRSSLDIVDSAYGSGRIQTMSVDLGNPSQHYANLPLKSNCGPIDSGHSHLAQHCYQPELKSNKISDESFSSAKSHQSDTVKQKSLSKVSLSSSTSRVFQNQLCNLKKFFRYMPIRRSFANNSNDSRTHPKSPDHSDSYQLSSQNSNLGESVSQLCLNRSQSPPVCPPPPGELKSMSYMESSTNYSNYDEFTRARNKQASTLLNNHFRSNNHQQSQATNRLQDASSPEMSTHDEIDSWQLTSLPVTFERNLTTVFEEKQNPIEQALRNLCFQNNNNDITCDSNESSHLIEPPKNFDDRNQESSKSQQNNSNGTITTSSQSLTSITTADSILDYHRQSATSFRFSYAQPNSFEHAPMNPGLPPKMPAFDQDKQGTSTGGSSSNSSLANSSMNTRDQPKLSSQTDRNSLCDYRTVTDPDSTIRSDTSTLQGDDANLSFKKKCAELESEVTNLGNKLSVKDKEQRELQLKLWSSDYLIDQLKSTIARLEKENAQLKSVLINSHQLKL